MDLTVLTERDRKAIRESFLFKGVQEFIITDALKDERCICTQYKAGQTVFDQNDFTRSLCFVRMGRLNAVKVTPHEEIPLRSIGTHTIFGAATLFNSEDSYISKVTAATLAHVISMPQEMITDLIVRNSRIALNYIEFLTNRIRFLDGKINLFICSSRKNALVSYLCSVMEDGQQHVKLDVSLTQLAIQLNMGRASLYRTLDALEEKGLIRRQGKEIFITEPSKLLAIQNID